MRLQLMSRAVGRMLVVAASILAASAASAQLPGGVSAQQLKAFQNLPQDQRDAILGQLGLKGSTGGGQSTGQSGSSASSVFVQTSPGQPGANKAQGQTDNALTLQDQRIEGGETVLLELALPEMDENGRPVAPAPRPQQGQDANGTNTPPAPASNPGASQQPTSGLLRQPGTQSAAAATKRQRDEAIALQELQARVMRGNPYLLSADGVLQLPGLRPIALAGLSNQEVQERLALEPSLRQFTVGATVLRVKPTGTLGLKPFGYEMFRDKATAFVPGTDIPVPDDYRLGPGDVVDLEIYGKRSQVYNMPVGRDGTINVPDLGPISVGGLAFGAAKAMLDNKIREQMIGTKARVSLSELRSARVLVLGDAEHPGSYVVSSLSSVTNALFAAGGVKTIGSLRDIQVKRAGVLVRRVDLYDALLRGDTSSDLRLQSGDVVFIPPVGQTVGVTGEVRRPAIYELRGERSVAQLVLIAGGAGPEADPRYVTIERIAEDHKRSIRTVDLTTQEGRDFAVHDGDTIHVGVIRPVVDDSVELEGHVARPTRFQYRAGLRLSDVLASTDELGPHADTHYVLIRREDPRTRRVSVISADLTAALAAKGGPADVELSPRDRLTVFDLDATRDRVVQPLLEELRQQGRPGDVTGVVTVSGRVNAPGDYPLEQHMRVADLVRAGGGLQDSAYTRDAELTHYLVATDGEGRRVELSHIDLGAALRGDPSANVALAPYDVLTIKETPEWRRVEEVELSGEVRFPGKYQIQRGETLRSVIERAGGPTSLAFLEGAVFTRVELREKEREQLDHLATRLQSDIATLSLQAAQTNPGATQAISAGQGLLEQLRQAKPVGRLVIDLDKMLAGRDAGANDVLLRDGDLLVIPRFTQEVSVLGEVQTPTSHLYRKGLSREEYVELSGGTTARADRKHIYVVRADGSVYGTKSGWLRTRGTDMRPGDTVVVPLDAEKMRPLPLWTAVTSIIYNLAVATAAVARL